VKLVASRHRRCEEETQDGCEPACSHGFKRGNRDDTRDTLGCDGDLGSTNAGALMQNRWLNLPSTPPFVAPCDLEIVTKRSGLLRGDCELKLDLLPQPWTGNVNTANVFRLALNPGFSATDYIDLQNPTTPSSGGWRSPFRHARCSTSSTRRSNARAAMLGGRGGCGT
jgi:hypothetical protein